MNFFGLFKKPQEPAVAFSLDNGYLRWVAVAQENHKHGLVTQVTDYGSEFLGTDIVDRDDHIIDESLFVRKLQQLNNANYAATKKSRWNTVSIVIPDGEAIMFHTHVTRQPEKEMGEIIMDHIKTYCQSQGLLQVTEYVCEYDIILKTKFGYDVHVTLVEKKHVDRIARLFKQAGMAVRHIETAHHAVAKSCLALPQGSGYVLVSFGTRSTTIALVHADHLVAQQTVSVGSEQLVAVVMRYLRISQHEADRIIARHGILQTHPDNGLLAELHRTLAPISQNIDHQLVTVGHMSYKMFGHRFTTKDVVVYGQGVAIKGILGFLGDQTRLRARLLDVWAGHGEDRAPILAIPAHELVIYAEPLSLALLYLKK